MILKFGNVPRKTPSRHLLERELEEDQDTIKNHLDDVRRVFVRFDLLDVLGLDARDGLVRLRGASWSVSVHSRDAWTLVRSRRWRRGGMTSR